MCLRAELYAQFAGVDFNESAFAAKALSDSVSAMSVISRVSNGIAQLQQLIRSQVILEHRELLASAAHVDAVEHKLVALQSQIANLNITCQK